MQRKLSDIAKMKKGMQLSEKQYVSVASTREEKTHITSDPSIYSYSMI